MEYQEESKVDVESPREVSNSLKDDVSSRLPEIDQQKERKLIWKMDLHILPFVVLLYLFSFLDRGVPRLTLLFLRN